MKLSLVVPLFVLAAAGCSSESSSPSSSDENVQLGVTTQALSSSLKPVASFGSNPGGLKLYEYVPANLPANAPLVLVLHGCTQGAADVQNLGWNELADQYGFAVGYPEQTTANNSVRCFNWGGIYGDMTTLQRNKGENASIKQMADALVQAHGLDSKRVYIAGFSAGGGMAVMVGAVWPDVFAGVASFSGLPYACPTSYSDVFTCQNPGVDKTPAEWGAKVKNAFSWSGTYPRISVWQGASDTTVGTKNRTEIVRQWTNIHGISDTPSVTGTVDGANYTAFKDAQGNTLVESYEVPGMAHGVAVAPSKQCGSAGQYAFDKGICTSTRVAEFFGLVPSSGPGPVGDGGTTTSGGDGGTSGTKGDGGAGTGTGTGSGTGSGTGTGAKGGNGANGTAGGANGGFDDERSPGSTCSAAPGRAASSPLSLVLFGLGLAALTGRARRLTTKRGK